MITSTTSEFFTKNMATIFYVLCALLLVFALLPVDVLAKINIPTIDGATADKNDILKTVKQYFHKGLTLVIYVLYIVVFIGGGYMIVVSFLEAKNAKDGWGKFILTFFMVIIGVALSVYFLSLAFAALKNIA